MRLPVLLVSVVLAVLPPGGTFIDDDGSIHEGGIEAIAAQGITVGCNPPTGDRYCPDDPISRGEMAAFIARAKDLSGDRGDFFVDDDDHRFETAIDRIAAARIALGCDPPRNERFCPDETMTRGQMAMMLARAFDPPSTAKDHFVDDEAGVAEGAIDRIAAAGVTLGCNPPANDRYCPDAVVSRAQMATFLTRALGLIPLVPPSRPRPVLGVVSRETWGAAAPVLSEMVPHVIDRITVHHAGTYSDNTSTARIRGWQDEHMVGQGWPDLAYHIVIGVDGTVYEGRDRAYRGDTNTAYDTTGHLLVMVDGNFEVQHPTAAQWETLVAALAWAAVHYGVEAETISGHGDHAATLCPGRHLEDRLHSGDLMAEVQDQIDAGGVDLRWP
jgi:N-acetylmuramoyl-L-alanine amidase